MKTSVLTFSFIISFLCFSLFFTEVSAQSKKISIQGFLKDANGKAVDNGTYSITFKLYDVESGGAALWTEINPTVNVFGGIYTVKLGAITNISTLAWDVPYFLGVTVQGTELSPRTELTYAPYAIGVANAVSATTAQTALTAIKADTAKVVLCSGAVGDIKYSILNPTQFAARNGNCWVPMDGRNIFGSKLATDLGTNVIPDAGGMFLRSQEFSGSPNIDPDRTTNSAIAVVQAQAFLLHNHSSTASNAGNHSHSNNADGNTVGLAKLGYNETPTGFDNSGASPEMDLKNVDSLSINSAGDHTHTITVGNAGGTETRPINLNVWTYIRIN